MRMRSILVSGFKNIKKSRLELENICAVVSPNNYGNYNKGKRIRFERNCFFRYKSNLSMQKHPGIRRGTLLLEDG